jgi:hypothetical protein
MKAFLDSTDLGTPALRQLDTAELKAVSGGATVGLRPLTNADDPRVQAFLNGFYSTCGCSRP